MEASMQLVIAAAFVFPHAKILRASFPLNSLKSTLLNDHTDSKTCCGEQVTLPFTPLPK